MVLLRQVFACLTCCGLALPVARAQYVSTIHETIEADSAEAITLDFAGDVEAANWPGNTVLVETDVRMYNTSEGAFDFFVKEDNRYAVASDLTGGTLRIYSEQRERKPITSSRGVAKEEVKVRIHVPHRFAIDTTDGGGVYTRIYVKPASQGLRTGELARRQGSAPKPEPAPAENLATPDSTALATDDDPDIELLDASRLIGGVVISVDSSLVDFTTAGADTVRVDSAAVLTAPDRR